MRWPGAGRVRYEGPMPHFVVLVRPAVVTRSFVVHADRWAEEGVVCRFFRDDALVHQVAARDVLRVETHDTDKAARDALLDYHRSQAGGTTVRVEEHAAPRPRQREEGGAPVAIPAEGISVRIEER